MLKKRLHILRSVIILAIGLLMALISAAFGSIAPRADLEAAAVYQAASPTPTAQVTTSTVGSTDGIVWLGVIIMVIILLPILLRRETWIK